MDETNYPLEPNVDKYRYVQERHFIAASKDQGVRRERDRYDIVVVLVVVGKCVCVCGRVRGE